MFLGDISYSLYLWHSIVLMGSSPVRHRLLAWQQPMGHVLFIILVVPLTIVISWASFKFLEVPLRNRFRAKGH